MSYQIVKYRPAHREQLLELQKHNWGPYLRLNAANLDWKLLNSPYLSNPCIYLAFCGDELVGIRAMFGTKWQLKGSGEETVIPFSCDTLVLPEHRKHGLLGKLTEFALKDLAALGYSHVGLSSAGPATHIQAVMSGWRCLGAYEMYTRAAEIPIKTKAVRDFFLKQGDIGRKVRKYVMAPFHRLTRDESKGSNRLYKTFASGEIAEDVSIKIEAKPRASQMAELAAKCRTDSRIHHVRDEDYFAWRYLNPKRAYCFFFLERDQQLDAFMVLQSGTSPMQSDINIVDWEAVDINARRSLLDAALKIGSSIGFSTWVVSLTDEEKKMLRTAGFAAVPQPENVARTGPGFILRNTLDPKISGVPLIDSDAFFDLASWDLRMIDADNL